MSDEKFLCHRSVHDDISKRAYKEGAKAERENPCTENGCTDTENCDEICQHSRIYSPVQMQQAIARATEAENKRVLDEAVNWAMKNNVNYKDIDGDMLPAIVTGRIVNKLNSLRLAQPEPTGRDPE